MLMRLAILFAAPLAIAAPAQAELPAPVRAMLDAAIEIGDAKKVDVVVELAKQTNPADAAEIEALATGFRTAQREREALAKAEREAELRSAGLLENWQGKGEVGASRSTGNSSSTGVTGAVELARKGIDWTHHLRLRADYQRTNGFVSRERYLAAYEPRYQMRDNLFVYGLGQFERDRIQGYDARYAVSGGLGTRILDSEGLTLDAKAGPAYRLTEYTNGDSEGRLAALVGIDFDWDMTDRIKLTQDGSVTSETGGMATAIIDSSNVSVNLLTGLQFRVSDKLSTRLSYQVDYESSPQVGKDTTDTLSRFGVVYNF